MAQQTRKRGMVFLLLALLAFGGLGLEMLLAFLIEPLIYGVTLNNFNTAQIIVHWLVTCAVWLAAAVLLLYLAKRKYGFSIFKKNKNLTLLNWVICLAVLAVSITISVVDWSGLKVVKEFVANGWLKFIFQYVYYFFETILVYLIIVFGQEAGESLFKTKNIPYGGILAALTWGLIHALTQGTLLAGILSAVFAVLFGVVYLLANKNVRIAFVFILLMLIL